MKITSIATMSRSFWAQAQGLLEQPRTFPRGALNRAQLRWVILRGTGYRIWRCRMKTLPIFRFFWVQAQGVLERPRTLALWAKPHVKTVNAAGRSQWRWGISTGMGSRTWRWLMAMFGSC